MDYIHRMPFILGSLMAIIVGVVNLRLGADCQDIYAKMAVSLIVFFIIGLFARNTIRSILEEVEKKKKLEEENKKAHEAKKQAEEQGEQHKNAPSGGSGSNVEVKETGANYTAHGGEEFTPLKVADALRRTAFKE